MPDSLLLHICCAPCSTVVLPGYRDEGFDVSGYFYNPAIHPYRENRKRLETLEAYADRVEFDLISDHAYPLEENLTMLLSAENRCLACFTDRLETTALKAAEKGIGTFSTTLSVSPWQDHDLILEAGNRAARLSGCRFLYRDFRSRYRKSVEMSRELGLYRQSYCGCILSERDRYAKEHKSICQERRCDA